MLIRAVSQLRSAQRGADLPRVSVRSIGRSEREWRVSDRLGETELQQLVTDVRSGIPKRRLVERYGISESSVKRVIRRQRSHELTL